MGTRSTAEALRADPGQARLRGAVAAGGLVTAAVWPVQHVEDGPVVCPFRLLTGLYCPFCGMTRSFVYTLHGHVGDAFAAHLFGPALVLLAAVWAVSGRRSAGTWSDPSRWFAGRARPWFMAVAAAWVLYAASRWVAQLAGS
jgi:hypothetical protein